MVLLSPIYKFGGLCQLVMAESLVQRFGELWVGLFFFQIEKEYKYFFSISYL